VIVRIFLGGLKAAVATALLAEPEYMIMGMSLEHIVGGLDAVVQCGTNMSLLDVTEKLEPQVGIPILGINAVLFWYALRENGCSDALTGGGRLMREF
jgi:maleate cis-trans isomerase